MHLLPLHRLAAVVAVAGALVLGWGVGGVAAMDADLATAAAIPAPADHCQEV